MSRHSTVEWGSIRGARLPAQQIRWTIRWMGVRIVEVFIPHMKADVGGEMLPDRKVRRTRRGVRGSRKGTPRTRSTHRRDKREASKLAARSQGAARPSKIPSSTRVSLARTRFVNWVDRRVNVIKDDVIAGLDVDDLVWWESQDFHPTMVPWDATRITHVVRRPDGTFVPPWKYSVRRVVSWRLRRAWDRRCRLLRELASKKGRSPPPFYVERGMAVKLRTWYSGSGGNVPKDGVYHPYAFVPPPTPIPIRREVRVHPRERFSDACRHRAHRHFTTCPSGHGVGAGYCRCPFCGWRR